MLCAGTEPIRGGTQLVGGGVRVVVTVSQRSEAYKECARQRGNIEDMVLRSTRELAGLGTDSTEFPGLSPLNSRCGSEQQADVSRLQALPISL